jgi:SAM-dependent methyltransferase
MYNESARVYDALNRGKDYREASRKLREVILARRPGAASLLDVACGTGRHLEHLREFFRVEGLDKSPGMLDIARERCPGIPFHVGDLTDFQLSRTFDAVTCLFGSASHALSPERLRRAVQCMADHLTEGGVLAVEPWIARERFRAGLLTLDTVDDPDLKIARMYVSRAEGRTAALDIDYLVCTPEGVRHFTEHQDLGLFDPEDYLAAFRAAGLEAVSDEPGLFGYGLYVGARSS